MKPFLIGITGGSGSGKTSFIRRLQEHFSTGDICVISQDDYYLPQEEQTVDGKGIENFDLPDSIDKAAFLADIQHLMNNQTVTRTEYTFNNPNIKPKTLTFHPAPILIVEGIFVLHFEEIRDLLALKVYLHAKDNLKVIRRILRDRVERNYPLDDVLYRYQYHVLPTYEKYIMPYKEEADLIVNNNHHFDMGLEVLIGFLQNHLDKIAFEEKMRANITTD